MTRRKRKLRTTSGARLLAACLLLLAPAAAGGDKDKKEVQPALIAGTVFRDPGFALARAEVVLTVKTPPEGVKAPKAQKTQSDARGEFYFRVPPVKGEYLVSVRAPGFTGEEKVAAVSGGPERVDLYFTLKPVK